MAKMPPPLRRVVRTTQQAGYRRSIILRFFLLALFTIALAAQLIDNDAPSSGSQEVVTLLLCAEKEGCCQQRDDASITSNKEERNNNDCQVIPFLPALQEDHWKSSLVDRRKLIPYATLLVSHRQVDHSLEDADHQRSPSTGRGSMIEAEIRKKQQDESSIALSQERAEPWWTFDGPEQEDQEREVPPFRVTLSSSLSKSGGMHRQLSISIDVEHNQVASSAEEMESKSEVANMTMFVLLVVSESWFVDVEDPFASTVACHNGLEHCNVEWIYPSIIDIEDPAIDAIPHFVPIKISFRGHPSAKHQKLDFAVNVHSRYPLLSDDTTRTQTLYLIEPLILGGFYETLSGGEENIQNYYHKMPEGSAALRVHTTTVGAGAARDYDLVLAVTMVASLIGFLINVRDLSRISRWD